MALCFCLIGFDSTLWLFILLCLSQETTLATLPNHLVSFSLALVFQTHSLLQLYLVLIFRHFVLVTCSKEIGSDGVVTISSQSYIHR